MASKRLISLNTDISKIHGPRYPCLTEFFTKNSYLWSNYLMIFISWGRERSKLTLRNYFPLTSFTKRFILDVWISLGYWICQDSEYTKVLKYTSVQNMFLILNMSEFWICHGSKYARVTQGFEYAWITPGYSCLYDSKSVWMFFVSHLPIVIPYLKEP